MKIIHTSDWHIGKSIYEISLIEDQKMVLSNFLMIIEEEKPDVIIIAGDLYDRPIPSKEAVNLLDDVFYEIVSKKQIPILCVSGNHDSGERLEFASRILRNNNLFIEGKIKKDIQKIIIDDCYGRVNFFLIPFGYVSEIRECYKDDSIKTFDDAFRVILEKIEDTIDKNERNVIITHGFIISDLEDLEISDSVRPLSVGTTEYVNVEYFKHFDYTALGHLHRPQKVKWDYIRYSGSLLKYSFSEANHIKSVTVVDIKEKGNIIIKNIPLKQNREVKMIEGYLKDLINVDPNTEGITSDYYAATLKDENVIFNALGQLKAVYPNLLRMDYKNRNYLENIKFLDDLKLKEKKSDIDLFEKFFEEMTGRELTKEKKIIVEDAFKEILLKGGDLS